MPDPPRIEPLRAGDAGELFSETLTPTLTPVHLDKLLQKSACQHSPARRRASTIDVA